MFSVQFIVNIKQSSTEYIVYIIMYYIYIIHIMYVDMQLLYIYIYIHMSTISIPFKSTIEVPLFDAPGAYFCWGP